MFNIKPNIKYIYNRFDDIVEGTLDDPKANVIGEYITARMFIIKIDNIFSETSLYLCYNPIELEKSGLSIGVEIDKQILDEIHNLDLGDFFRSYKNLVCIDRFKNKRVFKLKLKDTDPYYLPAFGTYSDYSQTNIINPGDFLFYEHNTADNEATKTLQVVRVIERLKKGSDIIMVEICKRTPEEEEPVISVEEIDLHKMIDFAKDKYYLLMDQWSMKVQMDKTKRFMVIDNV